MPSLSLPCTSLYIATDARTQMLVTNNTVSATCTVMNLKHMKLGHSVKQMDECVSISGELE